MRILLDLNCIDRVLRERYQVSDDTLVRLLVELSIKHRIACNHRKVVAGDFIQPRRELIHTTTKGYELSSDRIDDLMRYLFIDCLELYPDMIPSQYTEITLLYPLRVALIQRKENG